MFVDSQSAIAMMANEKINKRNRHISRRVHFARYAKSSGTLNPIKIDGTDNPSDIGTKNLEAPLFTKHKQMIHVNVKA